MSFKKFCKSILNRELGLQERMFRLLGLISIVGVFVSLIWALPTGGNFSTFVLSLVMLAVIFIFAYLAIQHQMINQASAAIAFFVIYVFLPYNFLNTGGSAGGGAVWFIFGVVYVCLNLNGGLRYFMLASCALLLGACYWVDKFYPQYVCVLTDKAAKADIIISIVCVSVLTSVLILFQNYIYRKENDLANQQRKEIEELNRAQNRFFSSMSHELRTPINTIVGLNEMILREAISDDVRSDAQSIQGASRMLLALVNDVLDMSKIESGSMEIVPVNYELGDMLSELVNMVWPGAKEKGIDFHVSIDEELPSGLYGDEIRIKQVLVNILTNAVKYTPEGSVSLTIQREDIGPGRINLVCTVEDTGMGIKKENIPHLFEAFKRVELEETKYIEGTGLGLAIVKELVDLMGGTITVNSIYTKGSTFVVTIPQDITIKQKLGKLDFEAKHSRGLKERYQHSFEAPEAKILLVDDNEMNLTVAERLLEETKMQITAVTSGAEALAETANVEFDLVFMDHLMPGMDGIDCLHAMRTQIGGLNNHTPVIVLTANAGSDNRRIYEQEGFAGYLLKPITGKQLEAEAVRHLPTDKVKGVLVQEETERLAKVHTVRTKVPIIISTDSYCDLPIDLIERNRVAIAASHITTDDGDFLEGIEVETEEILSYISDFSHRVITYAPKVDEYESFFADNLMRAQNIIHIAMGRHISEGYDNAIEAAESFENVHVVDCGHVTCGVGMVVLKAAKIASSGNMTAEDLVAYIKAESKLVNSSFLVENTSYLTYNGRMKASISQICKSLQLYPMIQAKKSRLCFMGFSTGEKLNRWDRYVSIALQKRKLIDKRILFIAHVGLSDEDLEEIKAMALRRLRFEHVICQQCSPVISSNAGPGSFGLIFAKKSPRDTY